MKAFITSALNSGLGDMYSNIYRIYDVQEQLKKIGYTVKVTIEIANNPYKIHTPDRDIFKRIFKFEKLDGIEIITQRLENVNIELGEKYNKVYNYEHIYTIFVDEKHDEFDNVHHMKHSWYHRDDLPKINFLTDEVTEFAEERLKKIGKDFIGVHYRPFSSDNIDNIESDLDSYKPFFKDVLETHVDNLVFVSTNKNAVKKYLKSSEYTNYFINEFEFTDVHEGIRHLCMDDDILFEHLKESLCDMYLLSKCETIYRIANWFSGFLFFACTFNQTNVSNRLRFIPEQPIIPLI